MKINNLDNSEIIISKLVDVCEVLASFEDWREPNVYTSDDYIGFCLEWPGEDKELYLILTVDSISCLKWWRTGESFETDVDIINSPSKVSNLWEWLNS